MLTEFQRLETQWLNLLLLLTYVFYEFLMVLKLKLLCFWFFFAKMSLRSGSNKPGSVGGSFVSPDSSKTENLLAIKSMLRHFQLIAYLLLKEVIKCYASRTASV